MRRANHKRTICVNRGCYPSIPLPDPIWPIPNCMSWYSTGRRKVALPNNGFCGSPEYNFWSINRQPWPGDTAKDIGLLATLEMGKSNVLRLRDESPNLLPIHLHGLVSASLRSNQRKRPPLLTDTMLLLNLNSAVGV